MKILFLDQTGQLAGAERVLLDIAKHYKTNCLVGLFEDGPFRELLQQQGVPTQVLATKPIQVRRESGLIESLASLTQLIPLIFRVVQLSRQYDLIYVNTPKALVVGALASFLSDRPLVYHLHDILTEEHFSSNNRRLMVTLANRFACAIIAVSQASEKAFWEAGGRKDITQVIYNGFEGEKFQGHESEGKKLKQELGLDEKFLVGHFSRLSPWKGQHILIEALTHCPEDVTAIIVGDALFGEQEYGQQLRQQVTELGLTERVQFLGFRSDVPQLMAACDLIAHTSIASEPAARVLNEAMLCGKLLVATENGGTVELVENGKTGILVPPGDVLALAATIKECKNDPERIATIATQAQIDAIARFDLKNTQLQIEQLLNRVVNR